MDYFKELFVIRYMLKRIVYFCIYLNNNLGL